MNCCKCGSDLWERRRPVRGVWVDYVAFGGGRIDVEGTNSTDGLTMQEPRFVKCSECGNRQRNPLLEANDEA